MNIVLLFSHTLTDPQLKELTTDFMCENIIYMPQDIKSIWQNITDSTSSDIFEQFLLENLKENDYVLIQGDWGMTYKMINFAKAHKFIPIFSRTTRNVKEYTDGAKVLKTSIFEHIGFRKY